MTSAPLVSTNLLSKSTKGGTGRAEARDKRDAPDGG